MTHGHGNGRHPFGRRRLLVAFAAVALLAAAAPATPVLGGPDAAIASQGSGGGPGP